MHTILSLQVGVTVLFVISNVSPRQRLVSHIGFMEYVRFTLFFGNMVSWGSSWSRAEVSQIRARANV